MTSDTTKANAAQPEAGTAACLFDNWFDPIETGLRARVREFIEALIRGELDAALARPRYGVARRAVPMRWAALPVIATGAGHAR
jgi:putative transposase